MDSNFKIHNKVTAYKFYLNKTQAKKKFLLNKEMCEYIRKCLNSKNSWYIPTGVPIKILNIINNYTECWYILCSVEKHNGNITFIYI